MWYRRRYLCDKCTLTWLCATTLGMQDILACHEMTIARRLLKTEVKIAFPEKKRLCLTVGPYYSVPSQVYYFFLFITAYYD